MAGEEPRYEVSETKVIRGTEAKTVASKQSQGWELVDQQQGRLRTTMTFRRPKPKTPWRLWASLGGVGAVLAVVITVGALFEDDSDPSPTDAVAASQSAEQPASETVPEPAVEPAAPQPSEILTVDNNADLARILRDTDSCGQPVADFATWYAGRTIQFDGHIAAMNTHDDYETRYDILVGARDFDESDSSGPSFQFRDVNITSDLGLTGPNIPDTLRVLDTLRVTAIVGEFEAQRGCLFQLDPVSTEIR